MALVLTVVYEPIALSWTDHGERELAGTTVSLATWGRPDETFEVRLSSKAPFKGELHFAGQREIIDLTDAAELDLRVPDDLTVIEIKLVANDQEATWHLGRRLR